MKNFFNSAFLIHCCLLLVAFVFSAKTNAQCPPGSVTFSNQAQLNAFLANYPNCTQITGNVVVFSSPANAITSVAPLANLQTITGTLHIEGNTALTTLAPLSNLKTVGQSLYIYNSDGLTGVNGLNKLETIGALLYIFDNASLTTLNGFKNLKSIGTALHVNNCDLLTSFNAFGALTQIGTNLVIVENAVLNSISGLLSVQTMNGFIHVENNPLLTSLHGLNSINPAGITFLYLLNSVSLSACGVQSICGYLSNPAKPYLITNNGSGCMTRAEILSNCIASIPGCTNPNSHDYNPSANFNTNVCGTCSDGIENGDEAGIDCGGTLCDPCPVVGCMDPSAHNYNPLATIPDSCQTCFDGVKNGDESGIDCGGTKCDPCPNTCSDCILNGDEILLDCGGTVCDPCPGPPFVTCPDVTVYADPFNPVYEGETTDENIYEIPLADFDNNSFSFSYCWSQKKISRGNRLIKSDWTTLGACEDNTPNGVITEHDKGKFPSDCLPVLGSDIEADNRRYKILVTDVYGYNECSGKYWVEFMSEMELARPKIQIHTHEEILPKPVLETNSEKLVTDLSAVPNPGNSDMTIKWHSRMEARVQIVITDLSGQVLSKHNTHSPAGNHQLTFDMSRFSPGLYLVHIQNGYEKETVKWMKQ